MKANKKLFISVIIPYKKSSPYIVECLRYLKCQSYPHFEVIILPDNKEKNLNTNVKVIQTGSIGPAQKRDIAARHARGDILAFIDDDAYPSRRWLESAILHFKNKEISAVCGPGMTPADTSWTEQASGWFSASPLGGGSYTYRFLPQTRRYVDDYPSMNLIVRKDDFLTIGGFDSGFWPGEDTKLCLDIVHKLGKKILYDPTILVYHHRRPVWVAHLAQNGNFGLHRGYFARILPKTSFRFIYFLPSFLVIGLVVFPYIIAPVYAVLLIMNSFWIYRKSGSLLQGMISIPVVFHTHIWYGVRFIQGFLFTKQLIH